MAAFLLTKGFIKATIYFCFAVNNQLFREAKAFPEVIFSLQGPNFSSPGLSGYQR